MRGKLIYPSILLFLLTVFMVTDYGLLSFLLFTGWLLRLLLKKDKQMIMWSFILCFCFLSRYYVYQRHTDLTFDENSFYLIHIKETTVEVDGDRLVFQGDMKENQEKETVIVHYTFQTENEKELFEEEMVRSVEIKGQLKEPSESTNFNQFDYKLYLKRQNIHKLIEAETLKITSSKIDQSSSLVDSLRQKILTYIDSVFTPSSAGYTKALLFADKRQLPESISESFRALGIVHLLSISGLHVHILIVFIKAILLKSHVTKETTHWLLNIILPFYGLLTGFSISIFRAIGQVWVKSMGETVRYSISTLDSWAAIFSIALFINPNVVFNVGFQLSYLISCLIIMLTRQPYFKRYTKFKAYWVLNVLIFVSSIPILTYHFYEFSWGVLLLNSLYIPFMSFVFLPILIVAFLLSLVLSQTPIFTVMLKYIDLIIGIMEKITVFISEQSSFSFVTGRLSQLATVLLVLCIVSVIILLDRQNKNKLFFAFPIIGMAVSLLSVRYSPYGQVMMIEVGQGESILIKEPWGRGNYLIDTGGVINWSTKEEWQERENPFSLGEDVIVPVLKSQGVKALDTLIITHPDRDHYGALKDILLHIPVQTIASSINTFENENLQALLRNTDTDDMTLSVLEEQSKEVLPENVKFIYPMNQTTSNNNNHSVVLLGRFGEYTWLFTGDLEKEGEEELLRMYPNLKADVLKVGHHGSDTSTKYPMLEQLSPSYALISAGKNNRYNHPHPDVLERLGQKEVITFRTDENGALNYTYTTNSLINRWMRSKNPISSHKEIRTGDVYEKSNEANTNN